MKRFWFIAIIFILLLMLCGSVYNPRALTYFYSGTLGDIDNNDTINAIDYMMLKRHVLGIDTLTDAQQIRADMNSDGKIKAIDYMLLKRQILNAAAAPNTVCLLETPISVVDFLNYPTKSAFGKYYDYAVRTYNAILHADIIELELSIDTEIGCAERRVFIYLFEKHVTSGFPLTYSTISGGRKHILKIDTAKLRTEILAINKYKDALSSAGIYNGMPIKEAIVSINNWMIKNITYDLKQRDAYTALITGKANCMGYAKLFQHLCNIAGIECEVVSGFVKIDNGYQGHDWNRVKIGTHWYHIDVCWNDARIANEYLLSAKLWSNHVLSEDYIIKHINN